jgi:hypothetical protein
MGWLKITGIGAFVLTIDLLCHHSLGFLILLATEMVGSFFVAVIGEAPGQTEPF